MNIFGIDLGHGWVKHTQSADLKTAKFPAIVREISNSANHETLGNSFDSQGPWTFSRNGKTFLAGPGIEHILGADSRSLDEQYLRSLENHILYLAALRVISVPNIDHLGVGVPVSTSAEMRAELRDRWEGTHALTDGHNAKCVISKVSVFTQGFGAYIDHCFREASRLNDPRFNRGKTALVVDVGYTTLDWVVVHDKSIDAAQSGSVPLGASVCLNSIGNAIVEKASCRSPTLKKIEFAMINNLPIKAGQHEFRVEELASAFESIVSDGIANILGKVRNITDVDEILLTGGGARFYEKELIRKFPNHKIHVMENAQFANVMGYHRLLRRKYG